jgi:hypothetical protein
MRLLKNLLVFGLLLLAKNSFAQYLPPSYQPMLNEIIIHFETIRGSNSITKGKTTLSVINEEKIALRMEHKKRVKNLTFEISLDEESKPYWAAANELTIDMVDKYEKDLTKALKSMHKLSLKRSQE